MGRTKVLGVEFDVFDMRRAVEAAVDMALSGQPHVVITANPEFVYNFHHNPRLRELVRRADAIVADGSGIIMASRLLGSPLPERVPGVELVEGVFASGAVTRVYLLGAKPGVAAEAGENLHRRYPHVRVVGSHHGYFRQDEERAVISEIAGSGAQVLLAGMGAPKQEIWLLTHREELNVPLMIGVGGSRDVFAGRVKRAPGWARQLQIEWLYRMLSEPRRLRRFPCLVWFAGQVFASVLASKLTKGGGS